MDVRLQKTLDGQVALVTGGNRGIGRAIAQGLASRGATVYAGTRRLEGIAPAEGIVPVRLDVTDESTIVAAIQRIDAKEGRLDVLVNNAAIYDERADDLSTEPTEVIDRVLAVNLRGAMLTTKHALHLLLRHRGSRIVNVSSGSGSFTDGLDTSAPAYGISKAALNGLTVYLHGAFARKGLIVNSVCPGWVRTDMGGPHAPRSVEKGAETAVWLAMFAPDGPSGLFWRDRKVIPW